MSLLTARMFDRFQHDPSMDIQFMLQEGQIRAKEYFHNARWYNRLGVEIGWGDLDLGDIQAIQTLLPEGEYFLVVPEKASWDYRKKYDRTEYESVQEWLAAKVVFMIEKGKCHNLCPDYLNDEDQWIASRNPNDSFRDKISVRSSRTLLRKVLGLLPE